MFLDKKMKYFQFSIPMYVYYISNFRECISWPYLPWPNVCKSPKAKNKLDGVKDALEEEESPELHDGGVEDVHHEAGHVSHPLWRNADIYVGHTLKWITPWLRLETVF